MPLTLIPASARVSKKMPCCMASTVFSLTAPWSIYELHLGSWKRSADGAEPSYRSLAPEIADYALPVYINAPLHDGNFRWRSVDKCVSAARPVYELLGAPDKLVVRHPDYDHNFKEAERQEAYRMIDSVLRPTR